MNQGRCQRSSRSGVYFLAKYALHRGLFSLDAPTLQTEYSLKKLRQAPLKMVTEISLKFIDILLKISLKFNQIFHITKTHLFLRIIFLHLSGPIDHNWMSG